MITVGEVRTVADVLTFGLWVLVVWGVANAVFRSYPAAALHYWLMTRGRNQQELGVLRWELNNRREFNPAAVRGDPLVKPRDLTPEELQQRQARLAALVRATMPLRVLNYLFGCAFCQHAWAALTLVLCFARGLGFWSELVPTAIAYATAATVALGRYTHTIVAAAPQDQRATGGCPGGCGRSSGQLTPAG